MHLFVETNFVLEMFLEQEQALACNSLLSAAERGEIQLYLPAFCLMEPVYSLGSRSKQRKELWQQVNGELQQAARETSDKTSIQELSRSFDTVLVARNQRQQQRLLEISTRLAGVANLVPLTREVWQGAISLLQTTELTLPDALVGASVLGQLSQGGVAQNLFLTRDRKAFKIEVLEEQLQAAGCAVMFNFVDAAQRLRVQ